jgi:chromosome partitioning protein
MLAIVLANEKGGVGKTTLAFHLACFCAEAGYSALAVDLDPQGNLGYLFTGEQLNGAGGGERLDGIERVVRNGQPLRQATVTTAQYDGRLSVLPGSKSTGEVRNWLAGRGSRLDALRPLFDQAGDYDFVLVDTPPSPAIHSRSGEVLDALTVSALYVSRYVLAPFVPEALALGGLAALSATLDLLQERGSSVRLLGVAPTMYDGRTNEHLVNLLEVAGVYGPLVYPVVNRAIAVSRCAAFGRPVWAFDRRNPVSEQLRAVAGKVVQDVEAAAEATGEPA